MTTAQLAPPPIQKFYDNNGNPLAGGLLYSYAAGTNTPQATYPSSSESTPNTNPIVLNFRGECALWLDPALSYKLNLTDVQGNTISGYPVDNIQGVLSASVGTLLPNTTNTYTLGNPSFTWANLYLGSPALPLYSASSGIAAAYGQTAVEIAANVTPTNYSYAPYNVLRYGADPTGASSSLTAFNNAYTAAMQASPHGSIYIPAGTYLIPSPGLTWTNQNDIRLTGDGPDQSILQGDAANSYTILTISADTGGGTTGQNLNLSNFGIKNGAAASQHALACSDYLHGSFANLQCFASGNVFVFKGLANITSTNLYGLSWQSNSIGSMTLDLDVDTHGVPCGPMIFNACHFDAQNSPQSTVVTNQATGATFIECFFAGRTANLTAVCNFTNKDDIGLINCYTEGSCSTANNNAVLFYIGQTAAPVNVNLIGGHFFSGDGTHSLKYAVSGGNFGNMTIVGATFANFATAGINYGTSGAQIEIVNCSAPGGGGLCIASGLGAPSGANIQFWIAPGLVTGWGTPVGGAVINNYNITDAGGSNSNTNKALAKIITDLKTLGIYGA